MQVTCAGHSMPATKRIGGFAAAAAQATKASAEQEKERRQPAHSSPMMTRAPWPRSPPNRSFTQLARRRLRPRPAQAAEPVERPVALVDDRGHLGPLLGRQLPVARAERREVTPQRRGKQPALEAAHRRDGDQLLVGVPVLGELDPAVVAEPVGADAPVPEPGGLALVLDLRAGAHRAVSGRGREEPLRVERVVERLQLDEPERPQQHAEAFALPDRLDHRRVVLLGGEHAECRVERLGERADPVEHIAAAPELRAGHRLEASA